MEIKLEKEKQILGIATQTNNQAEMAGVGKISRLWEKFFKQGIGERLSAKSVEDRVFALYTDYESDENGEYTLLIGKLVEKMTEAPVGLVLKTIPEARYVTYTSKKGPLAKVVPETWQQIWQDDEVRHKRSYSGDYEVYERAK